MAYFTAGGGIAASEQFAFNQTDVFSVDQNGQLNVSWVDNAGEWQGPMALGPTGVANPGSPLAASRQFGLNQTDVFLVNKSGQLVVYWVDNAGGWSGPGGIGPAGNANAGSCVAACQQFGLNQTDVFLFDKNGQLNVFWVDNAGAWQGPGKIGPAGIANAGSPLAVSQQFGLTQTDVFVIDKNGQLNVYWVDGAGAWQGPGKIGPAGLANPGSFLAASQQFGLNQTDVFVIDKNGQLNVFWVDGGGAWQGPGKIGPAGVANAGSPLAASQQFGLTQTDVFVVNKSGQLVVYWVDGGGAWQGPGGIGPVGYANAGSVVAASQQFGLSQTDVFLVDKNGQENVFWVDNAGAWQGPQVRGNPVAAPSAGLGSNSNYFINDNCTNLTGVVVAINVQSDITGSDGFGFQVNCYSAKSDFDAAQQYLIYLSPHSSPAALTCMVDNWTAANTQICNSQVALCNLPSHTLPAGYELRITLNNDSNGNITGATYVAIDNNGHVIGNQTITILSLSGMKQSDLAPIVAYQLNFVDYLNGGNTVLSSGAGTIYYSATNVTSVGSGPPSCIDWDYHTVETANSVYGGMSSTNSHTFTQSFHANVGGASIKAISKMMHITKGKPGT
jgi:hypothetical protein